MKKNKGGHTPATQGNGHRAVRGLLITALLLLSIVAFVNVGFVQNAQALDPHIVTGTVYEANGTTCNSCNVTVTNARTGESSSGVTSNATGIYAYNLLNLASGYMVGDTIQVEAENATGENGTNSTQITIGSVSTTIDVWIGTTQAVSGVTFFIIDEDGYPVNNAYVNIKDSQGDIEATPKTGSNGRATYSLSDGLYTLTVSKSGYDDVTKDIRVHGTSNYAIRLGEIEAPSALADIWTWLFLILAIIGIVALILYAMRRI